MPTALIQGRIAVQFKHLLRKELDDSWNIHVWDPAINNPEEFVAMAFEADAIIGGKIPADSWPQIPNLKLFQIPWTGYDFCSPESMPQGVPVCNCYEHERPIAEFVLCAMLESKIGLRKMDQNFVVKVGVGDNRVRLCITGKYEPGLLALSAMDILEKP